MLSMHHAAEGNAVLMGLVYGLLHVIGPDHLGTLMTLSAAAAPARAFSVGAAWGFGHSFGVVFIGAVFVSFHHMAPAHLDAWEHYGDYVIGLSMMLCAAYFMLRESAFLQQEKDGSIVAKPCACHGHFKPAPPPIPHRRSRDKIKENCCDFPKSRSREFCGAFSAGGNCEHVEHDHEEGQLHENQCCETTPLVVKDTDVTAESLPETWGEMLCAGRSMRGAIIGIFQGFCCPMGVVSLPFLANLSATGVFGFLFTFLIVSALGTATLAMCWAALTGRGIGSNLSQQVVFRGSCAFTMALGVLWIIANYYGLLEKLNYAEHVQMTPTAVK